MADQVTPIPQNSDAQSAVSAPPSAGIIEIYRDMLAVAGNNRDSVKANFYYALAGAIFEALALLCFFPLLQALFLDDQNPWQLAFWLAVMTMMVGIQSFCSWRTAKLNHSQSYVDVGHDLKTQLAEKLRTLPLETLYRQRTGELTSIIAGHTEDVVMMMAMVATMIIRPIVVPIMVVLACCWVSWPIALLMLILFPLSVPVYLFARKILAGSMHEQAIAKQQLTADLIEFTQGISVLRATNAVNREQGHLQASIQRLESIQRHWHIRFLLPNFLLSMLVEMGLWFVVLLGVWLIVNGQLAVPSLIAMVIITTRFAEPMSLLLSFMQGFKLFEVGLRSIRQLLETPTLTIANPPTSVPEDADFSIDIQQLVYQYPDTEQAALKHIDLTIAARSMTALVGSSGCGKTTLIRSLMRYGDPEQGAITIGGVDIRHIEPETLMGYFSVVFQDVYLFDESISANIALAKPGATQAEIVAAATLANAHDFISALPHGYDTIVGEIGSKLSGGEKQRISIARAILKDAPIVILDEPTAALDTESEVAVQQAIDTLVKDKTVIVIAHRLSTITHADHIAVLEDGQIVEQGQHDALIQQQGRYYDLWQAQRSAKVWRINEQSSASKDGADRTD